MRFTETTIPDVVLIDIEPRRDDRGFFARTHCVDEFVAAGLDPMIAQSSLGHNAVRGTLRGLHYQAEPFEETKVLRCVRGALFAVAVDLRPESPSYLEHVSTRLTADNRRALYVPKGCATGYQTLEHDTDIMYEISVRHAPGYERGVHHADETLAIPWPLSIAAISDRDSRLPLVETSEVA